MLGKVQRGKEDEEREEEGMTWNYNEVIQDVRRNAGEGKTNAKWRRAENY